MLASTCATASAAFLAVLSGQPWPITLLVFFCVTLIVLRHHENLMKIVAGREEKMFHHSLL